MFKFFSGILSIYMILVWILSGLIHLWTVYIGYSIGGIFWGFVTLIFPFVSEIYFGFDAWSSVGFEATYLQWLVILLAMWILQYVFAAILGSVEEKINKNMNY